MILLARDLRRKPRLTLLTLFSQGEYTSQQLASVRFEARRAICAATRGEPRVKAIISDIHSNLEAPNERREVKEKRWEFLAERPRQFKENGMLFVHGSARNPLNEYVFPEDIYSQRKMERIFALVERSCFQGHTHVPGIFTEQVPEDLYQFSTPEELDYTHTLDERKTLCNVGSVGQPRDGDWHACYVLLDGNTIRYRRVEYDIETTIRKIYAIPELENFLGDRPRDGR